MTLDPEWSALVVSIPEAEPVVGELRRRHDSSAAMGVDAHVTILFPFLAPAVIDEAELSRLAALYAGVEAFAARFATVGRFPGVLYLTPEPAVRWRALLVATWGAYPAYPPYEGIHDVVVPHLTVGEVEDPVARELEAEIAPGLPIDAAVSHVTLIASRGGPASVIAEFPLAAASGAR